MCTSGEDPEFNAQAKQKGALDVLSKSTGPEKLRSLLDRLQPATGMPAQVAEVEPAGRPAADRPQAAADCVSENGLDERIRILIEPLMGEFARRLTADLSAKTEQAQLTTNRLIDELLPQVVQQQLEDERQNIARMVRELIDTSLDSLVEEPSFTRRILGTLEATATSNAEEHLRRQAKKIVETIASERADAIADRLLQSSCPASGTVYLLAAGAALVGMISAAVVFLLLS
jgi:hypothetical protein